MAGYADPASPNYGNYQSPTAGDGAGCRHLLPLNDARNPTYGLRTNSVDVQPYARSRIVASQRCGLRCTGHSTMRAASSPAFHRQIRMFQQQRCGVLDQRTPVRTHPRHGPQPHQRPDWQPTANFGGCFAAVKTRAAFFPAMRYQYGPWRCWPWPRPHRHTTPGVLVDAAGLTS